MKLTLNKYSTVTYLFRTLSNLLEVFLDIK